MGKLKIMVVFGTRPEAIKMAPLVLELQKHRETLETVTVGYSPASSNVGPSLRDFSYSATV